MADTNDNLAIWNAVSKTDPKYTKQVNIGRKFTSIDGYYMIKRATEIMGPVGDGWAWSAEHSTLTLGDRVIAVCDVLVTTHNRVWGPVRAMNEIISAKGRFDEDAPKKAMTDALTKALSHLGIASDVYLGMFDDNKYVQEVTQEFAEKVEKISKTQLSVLNDLADEAGTDKEVICNAFGIKSLADLPADQYRRVERRLNDLVSKAKTDA